MVIVLKVATHSDQVSGEIELVDYTLKQPSLGGVENIDIFCQSSFVRVKLIRKY